MIATLLAAGLATAGPPPAVCKAEGRMEVSEVRPSTLFRQGDRPARMLRLGDLPAANLELMVLRRIDGCVSPAIVRHGVEGAGLAPQR